MCSIIYDCRNFKLIVSLNTKNLFSPLPGKTLNHILYKPIIGLKQENAISPLFLNIVLKTVVREVQDKSQGTDRRRMITYADEQDVKRVSKTLIQSAKKL